MAALISGLFPVDITSDHFTVCRNRPSSVFSLSSSGKVKVWVRKGADLLKYLSIWVKSGRNHD